MQAETIRPIGRLVTQRHLSPEEIAAVTGADGALVSEKPDIPPWETKPTYCGGTYDDCGVE